MPAVIRYGNPALCAVRAAAKPEEIIINSTASVCAVFEKKLPPGFVSFLAYKEELWPIKPFFVSFPDAFNAASLCGVRLDTPGPDKLRSGIILILVFISAVRVP